jgi:hypothetical protein
MTGVNCSRWLLVENSWLDFSIPVRQSVTNISALIEVRLLHEVLVPGCRANEQQNRCDFVTRL